MAKFEMSTVTLGELLRDPEALVVIDRLIPGVSAHPMAAMVSAMRASEALALAGSRVDSATLDLLWTELASI